MSAQPRNHKELVDLMMSDPRLRRRMEQITESGDAFIRNQILDSLRQFVRESDVELAFMPPQDIAKALKQFYKDARLDGNYIKPSQAVG